MNKHTPGPWTVFTGNWDENEGMFGIKQQGKTRSEQEANGCLIAAAPDMLEKLKEWANSCGDCDEEEKDPRCPICADTWKLINRAEGKKCRKRKR